MYFNLSQFSAWLNSSDRQAYVVSLGLRRQFHIPHSNIFILFAEPIQTRKFIFDTNGRWTFGQSFKVALDAQFSGAKSQRQCGIPIRESPRYASLVQCKVQKTKAHCRPLQVVMGLTQCIAMEEQKILQGSLIVRWTTTKTDLYSEDWDRVTSPHP